MAEEDIWETSLSFEGMALSELNRLGELLNSTDRRETILHSLKWTYWCTRQIASGGKFLVEDASGKIVEVVFPKVS